MASSPLRRQRSRTVLVGRGLEAQRERAAAGKPLTNRELAKSLGISESTLYKTRVGTRSGTKVLPRIRRADQDVYTLTVETVDDAGNSKVKTMNVVVDSKDLRRAGIKRRAFSEPKVAAHPQVREQVIDQLERNAASEWRRQRGSEPWGKRERERMRIVSARRPIQHRVTPRELHLTMPFPRVSTLPE